MARRALVFFPHNPWPPRSGAHTRFLEVASGLRELGCRLFLVSSRLVSDTPWTEDSARGLLGAGFEAVRVHRPGPRDYAVSGSRYLWNKLRGRELRFDSVAFAPPGLVKTFRRAVADFDPDVVVINYAFWDRLIDHEADRNRLRVLDTLDILTLQTPMRAAIAKSIPAAGVVDPAAVPDAALREDFFDRLGLAVDPRELATYDRYSVTLTISPGETEMVRTRCPHTRAVYLPVTFPVVPVANEYAGPPLFVAGNNAYNIQGYCSLSRWVVPAVRRTIPGATVRVLGPVCDRVKPADGLELAGYVPDLKAEYARARFAVCPVFGGTGQQIKVVEAMAHGLPVVALKAAADRSPLRHGETGLVATTAAEFAEHVRELWADPERCRKLGQAAREVVAADYSRDRLLRGLAETLETRTRE